MNDFFGLNQQNSTCHTHFLPITVSFPFINVQKIRVEEQFLSETDFLSNNFWCHQVQHEWDSRFTI